MSDKQKIEIGKRYETRDGRKAIIYATDGAGVYSVHGAVGGTVVVWTATGRWLNDNEEDKLDLVPAGSKHALTVWVNVYDDGWGGKVVNAWTTEADSSRVYLPALKQLARLAVPLTFHEGDGLDGDDEKGGTTNEC